MLKPNYLFLVLGLFFTSTIINGQDVIYVSQAATGTNTGESWTNAYVDLQSALTEA